MKTLEPIKIGSLWHLPLERLVAGVFMHFIYQDALKILGLDMENARVTALETALRRGDVNFKGGVFRGKFNARLSAQLRKLGAVWDRQRQGFVLSATKLPPALFLAATHANAETEKLVGDLEFKIADIPQNVDRYVRGLNLDPFAEQLRTAVDDGMRQTVAKEMGVQPEILPDMRQKLKADYTATTTKAIKGFADEETERLREHVEQYVREGRPRSELVEAIRGRLGVSTRRAQFIARQETSLFTSKLKETQYQNVGLDRYMWQAIGGRAGDGRNRPTHRAAHGRIFFWDHSKNRNPVLNDNGQPVHAGEDWNCRCNSRPVVERIT
jgi:SPP1 gp7 family putative phage head morphogenesis protein